MAEFEGLQVVGTLVTVAPVNRKDGTPIDGMLKAEVGTLDGEVFRLDLRPSFQTPKGPMPLEAWDKLRAGVGMRWSVKVSARVNGGFLNYLAVDAELLG